MAHAVVAGPDIAPRVFEHAWLVNAVGGEAERIIAQPCSISRIGKDEEGIRNLSVSVGVSGGQSGGAVYVQDPRTHQYRVVAIMRRAYEDRTYMNSATMAADVRAFPKEALAPGEAH